MEPNINDKSLKICVGIIHTDLRVIVSSEKRDRKLTGLGRETRGPFNGVFTGIVLKKKKM